MYTFPPLGGGDYLILQSKFPVEKRLGVPVLAWYLRTRLNIVSEQWRWAKSSNVLERLHSCSCDAAAHWHSSSSESEDRWTVCRALRVVRSPQCCKNGGRHFPPLACSLPIISNFSLSPKICPCAEAKLTPPTIVGRVATIWSMLILIEHIHANIMGSIQQHTGKGQLPASPLEGVASVRWT